MYQHLNIINIFYAFVAGYSSTERIYHSLMSCFTDKTMETVVNLGLDGEEDKNYESVIAGLESVLVTNDKNLHVARHAFQSRVQLPEENFDSWLTDLKNLAKLADFNCDNCMDARLLQQVVFGVYKEETRQMLFDVGPGLTLNRAARVIRATEFGPGRFLPTHVPAVNVLSNIPCPEEMYSESISITDQALGQEGASNGQPQSDLLQLQEEQPDSTTEGATTPGSGVAESSLNDPEHQPDTCNGESPSPFLLESQLKNAANMSDSSGVKKKAGKRRRQKSITDDSAAKKAKISQTTTSGVVDGPETVHGPSGDEDGFSTVIVTFDVKSEVNTQGKTIPTIFLLLMRKFRFFKLCFSNSLE
jgi:hypothetical protein